MSRTTGEERLLRALGESPSPHADIVLVLLAARQVDVAWPEAWAKAMRAVQPPRERSADADDALAEDRVLLRELRPHLQAAFEGRELTVDERKRLERLARRRLGDVREPVAA